MTTEKPILDGGSSRMSYPMKAAAALLGVYVAMHLAVGGILHVLAWPDAAAASATYGLVALPGASAASAPVVGPDELRTRDSPGPVEERTDGLDSKRLTTGVSHPGKDTHAHVN